MGNAALLGAAAGLLALTRAELVLYFPIVVLPLTLRARGLVTRDRVKCAVVAVVVAAIPVLPWVGYNLSRFNEPVTLSTGGDFTLREHVLRLDVLRRTHGLVGHPLHGRSLVVAW